MTTNAMPQGQQQAFPFQLYLSAKAAGKTRVERFGDFHHVLIEREDPSTKKILPPFTSVIDIEQLEQTRGRLLTQLEAVEMVIADLKKE